MNGESSAARASARSTFRPSGHEVRLGPDLRFVEGVLEFLRRWPAPDAPAPEGVLSFVRYDFNEQTFGSLGRKIRLAAAGPEPKGMHLCADPEAPVHVFETDLADEKAHVEALANRELGRRTMVLFTPISRIARVVCEGIPLPGLELDLSPGSDKEAWTLDDLDQTMTAFNIDVMEGTPLSDLVTDGHGLRPGGRRRYNEALYLHLRYGLGLDRRRNCGVRMVKTGLGFRPRVAGEERLTVFGRRTSNAEPRDEVGVLRRRVDRWSAGGAHPPLRLRCLCCDPSKPCSIAALPEGLTVQHLHLAP